MLSSAIRISNKRIYVVITAAVAIGLLYYSFSSPAFPNIHTLRTVRDIHAEKDIVVCDMWEASAFRRPNPLVFEDNFDFTRFSRHPNGPEWGWQVPSRAGKPRWDDQNTYNRAGPVYVALIEQGFVNIDGYPHDSTRRFALDPIFEYRGDLDFSEQLEPRNWRRIRSFTKLVTCVQLWGNNFYHFVYEELPRVLLVLDMLKSDPEVKLLIHMPSFAMQFLSLLGVSESQIVPYDGGIYYADQLWVTRPTPCGMPPKESLQLLHRALVPQDLPEDKRTDIVVILRHGFREVDNSHELVAALRNKYGREHIIEFDGGKSAAQSRDIFMKARMVVAPHGGALGNLIWVAPGTPLLEFVQEADPNMCYWHASAALDLVYSAVIARGSGSRTHFNVDVAKAMRHAELLLSGSDSAS
eukprot:TRINITY_DN2072_c0_g2_i3.p1 TRINITY_DN2072_c0_g2~~TRINITY_DN2072_c0_g2_i3.p1  ORF type:complete len:411 (+),score=59.50 TRINITY_DN2072_c0_g2_i3:59-1291(+)